MERYEFLLRVGEGAYGAVWRCRDRQTGDWVAIKKLKDVAKCPEEEAIVMREVDLLCCTRHINIIRLDGAYRSTSGRLYLVFDYVERSLHQELKASNRKGLSANAVKSFTYQLLQAVGYLHKKQIIHRDIKPSNILLSMDHVVKLCDFGFARPVSDAPTADYTTYVVTRWYRAPEVLVGGGYGPPVDIWSVGCILAEMLTGVPLFPGKSHHDQLWLILCCLGSMTERQLDQLDSDPQWSCFRLPTHREVQPLEQRLPSITAAAMDVVRACLHPDPALRATSEQLLAMPYFQGIDAVLPAGYPQQLAAQQAADAQAAAHTARARASSTPPVAEGNNTTGIPAGIPPRDPVAKGVTMDSAALHKQQALKSISAKFLGPQSIGQSTQANNCKTTPRQQRLPVQRNVTVPAINLQGPSTQAGPQQQQQQQQGAGGGGRAVSDSGVSAGPGLGSMLPAIGAVAVAYSRDATLGKGLQQSPQEGGKRKSSSGTRVAGTASATGPAGHPSVDAYTSAPPDLPHAELDQGRAEGGVCAGSAVHASQGAAPAGPATATVAPSRATPPHLQQTLARQQATSGSASSSGCSARQLTSFTQGPTALRDASASSNSNGPMTGSMGVDRPTGRPQRILWTGRGGGSGGGAGGVVNGAAALLHTSSAKQLMPTAPEGSIPSWLGAGQAARRRGRSLTGQEPLSIVGTGSRRTSHSGTAAGPPAHGASGMPVQPPALQWPTQQQQHQEAGSGIDSLGQRPAHLLGPQQPSGQQRAVPSYSLPAAQQNGLGTEGVVQDCGKSMKRTSVGGHGAQAAELPRMAVHQQQQASQATMSVSGNLAAPPAGPSPWYNGNGGGRSTDGGTLKPGSSAGGASSSAQMSRPASIGPQLLLAQCTVPSAAALIGLAHVDSDSDEERSAASANIGRRATDTMLYSAASMPLDTARTRPNRAGHMVIGFADRAGAAGAGLLMTMQGSSISSCGGSVAAGAAAEGQYQFGSLAPVQAALPTRRQSDMGQRQQLVSKTQGSLPRLSSMVAHFSSKVSAGVQVETAAADHASRSPLQAVVGQASDRSGTGGEEGELSSSAAIGTGLLPKLDMPHGRRTSASGAGVAGSSGTSNPASNGQSQPLCGSTSMRHPSKTHSRQGIALEPLHGYLRLTPSSSSWLAP